MGSEQHCERLTAVLEQTSLPEGKVKGVAARMGTRERLELRADRPQTDDQTLRES